jgi:hypothetical protein
MGATGFGGIRDRKNFHRGRRSRSPLIRLLYRRQNISAPQTARLQRRLRALR